MTSVSRNTEQVIGKSPTVAAPNPGTRILSGAKIMHVIWSVRVTLLACATCAQFELLPRTLSDVDSSYVVCLSAFSSGCAAEQDVSLGNGSYILRHCTLFLPTN